MFENQNLLKNLWEGVENIGDAMFSYTAEIRKITKKIARRQINRNKYTNFYDTHRGKRNVHKFEFEETKIQWSSGLFLQENRKI